MGSGRKKEDSNEIVRPNVEIGQTVMYSKFSGTEFEVSGATPREPVTCAHCLGALSARSDLLARVAPPSWRPRLTNLIAHCECAQASENLVGGPEK